MKLCCQLPQKLPHDIAASFKELIQRDFELVKRPDTQIIVKEPEISLVTMDQFTSMGLRFMNDREVLKSMVSASKDVDGILIGCFADPALKAARQLLKVPVVGMGEASLHYATVIGQKLAIITSDERFIPSMMESLYSYVPLTALIAQKPVRALTISEKDLLECILGRLSSGIIIDNFKKIADSCIEDGADVIIVGCGLVSPILTLNNVTEFKGAPVIDPFLIGVKMLEAMVDLKRANVPFVSRRGLYLELPEKLIAESIKLFG